jgi:bacterioferritin
MDKQKVIDVLNRALENEMGAIVKLLHHSFLVFGPGRAPVQQLLRRRATDSVGHAIKLGEKITALGGHPSIEVHIDHPPGDQTIEEMIHEDLELEQDVLKFYTDNLPLMADDIPLDQMFRDIIVDEQEHIDDFQKLLPPAAPGG